MLKFGKITETNPEKGLAKVEFDQDEIVSTWLPYTVKKTKKDKYFHNFDVGEHVACMMDENSENGVILGAIYSTESAPDGGAAGKERVKFEDGTEIEYDSSSKTMKVKIGETEFLVNESGYSIKRSGETLKKLMEDLIDTILAETHPTGTGPSGPPINSADYVAIKTRLSDLFEN